jgi:hypothetical protein
MKEKLKLYFFIFAGIALFGSSVTLWFMIYSDSAKNNSTKKSNIANECDQASGDCVNKEKEILNLSENKKKEIPDSFESDRDIAQPAPEQENARENFDSNKVTSTLLDRSLTKKLEDNKEEDVVKEESDNETKKEVDDKEDEEEEETDDDITVEVGSDD